MIEEQQERIIYEFNIAHSVRISSLQYKYLGKYKESLQNIGADPESTLKGTIQLDGGKKGGKKINIDLEKQHIDLTVCWHCRSILIPGLNVQVRIKYVNRKKHQEKNIRECGKNLIDDRILVYRCLNCNASTRFTGILAQKGSQYTEKNEIKNKNTAAQNKRWLDKVSERIRKKRRKHHRGTALNELLERKRRKGNNLRSKNEIDGLDLFDFMKR